MTKKYVKNQWNRVVGIYPGSKDKTPIIYYVFPYKDKENKLAYKYHKKPIEKGTIKITQEQYEKKTNALVQDYERQKAENKEIAREIVDTERNLTFEDIPELRTLKKKHDAWLKRKGTVPRKTSVNELWKVINYGDEIQKKYGLNIKPMYIKAVDQQVWYESQVNDSTDIKNRLNRESAEEYSKSLSELDLKRFGKPKFPTQEIPNW